MYRQHIGWKFGIVAGLAVVVITLIPQIIVCIDRGRDWQGSYAFTDPDELAYSAYLNSIIEGRPRRNNPYLGTKESPATAAGENFYSIQFLPSYGLALLAQLSGLSASTVFILLVPVMAFASSMTVFWLISDVTGDDKLAALGTMIILLSGVMVSESPFVSENAYGGFPFLRRYIPAVSFPVFFMFCVFVWRGFTSQARSAFLWSLAAGVSFGLLAYPYFYLWRAPQPGSYAWRRCGPLRAPPSGPVW